MRLPLRFWILGLSVFCAPLAYGEAMICPIGGEAFEVPGDRHCTATGLKTMDFRTVTNCENQLALPQCPSNQLPLYREFSAAELKVIEGAMGGEVYQNAARHSRNYLAYILEREIVPSGEIDHFFLLLDGYWNDFDVNLADEDYTRAFEAELELALLGAPANAHSYLYAISSYYALKREDFEGAKVKLKLARDGLNDENNDGFIETYLDKLTACLVNPRQAICNPDSPIMGNF